MRDFTYTFETSKNQSTLLRECLAEWNPQLSSHGYQLTTQSEIGLTYLRRFRPWWIVFPVILLFPIGLLFLIYKQEAQITATVSPNEGSGSSLTVTGTGPKAIAEAFAQMEV